MFRYVVNVVLGMFCFIFIFNQWNEIMVYHAGIYKIGYEEMGAGVRCCAWLHIGHRRCKSLWAGGNLYKTWSVTVPRRLKRRTPG